MDAIREMSPHDLQSSAPLLGKRLESCGGRANSVGIDCENRKRIVLPFDDPVQRRSRGFRNVEENQRFASHYANLHLQSARETAGGAMRLMTDSQNSPGQPERRDPG